MSADNRRRAQRYRVTFPVVLDTGMRFIHARVIDVSVGGAFVHTRKHVPIGTDLTMTPVEDAGEHVFELEAKVVRHVPGDDPSAPPGLGLQFIAPELPDVVGLLKIFAKMPQTRNSFLEELSRDKTNNGLSVHEIVRQLQSKRDEAA